MIIRIHNTGDPYKLPTLSVHIYIYIYRRGGLFLFLFSRVPFFFSLSPPPFIPSLSNLRPCQRVVATTTPPDSPVYALLPSLSSSSPRPCAKKTRRVLCLFPTPFFTRWTSPHYRATYLPHGQMLPYNGSFFFYTWYLISNSLSLSSRSYVHRSLTSRRLVRFEGEKQRCFCARRKGETEREREGSVRRSFRRRRRPRHTCACEEVRIGTEWKNEPTVWGEEEGRGAFCCPSRGGNLSA